MYVITGATGNTGKPLALALLKAGKSVRVIGRSAERLQELVDQGAEAAIGSLEDVEFLSKTFSGATAVYAMVPPNFGAVNFRAYQNAVSDAIVEALKKTGVKHVVTLSSIGAHAASGTGVVLGLHDLEQKLAKVDGVHVLHLRAGFFLENFFGMVGTVKQAGVLGGFPLAPDQALPMVHTQDIAQVAAEHLLALDFEGQSHIYVAGERDINLQDAAKVLGKAIGKPDLNYVQFPYEDARAGMVQMGVSESLADSYIEFSKSVNEELLHGDYNRSNSNVVSTPTSIEQFAESFAHAYQQS